MGIIMRLYDKKIICILPLMAAMAIVTGCQPKSAAKEEQAASTAKVKETKEVGVPVIQAKVIPVKLPKSKVCLEDGCTEYDFQTVQTNQKWINDYFTNRIKKADPNAFANLADQPVEVPEGEPSSSQSAIYVRYLGQNYNLATFALQTYSYSAGAAHGMSHQEFVNFDLLNKKHITVAELIQPDVEKQLVDALFEVNTNWLQAHNISREKLQLSDNFYYGANGIVFVYPIYELASYAEGMSELTLPYFEAGKFIKPEYLPSVPNYNF
ncbi:RsiV family protein [Acinetobacter pittii]|uniref:RsiV family protein n=1 Tax=Acinetobacter pittii TaxID=48296 RepID=UPI0025B4FCDF|nr:RsiV family protein [Acinetobacter pittii]MDN4021726.1 RsiV family protein [Acinetobacter pittii]